MPVADANLVDLAIAAVPAGSRTDARWSAEAATSATATRRFLAAHAFANWTIHLGDGLWDCPFPPEADAQGIDRALVVLQITVRPDGRAQAVRVVRDPGNGFGREARSCAMKHRWRAARDRDGTPIVGTTAPLRVRFVR